MEGYRVLAGLSAGLGGIVLNVESARRNPR